MTGTHRVRSALLVASLVVLALAYAHFIPKWTLFLSIAT